MTGLASLGEIATAAAALARPGMDLDPEAWNALTEHERANALLAAHVSDAADALHDVIGARPAGMTTLVRVSVTGLGRVLREIQDERAALDRDARRR